MKTNADEPINPVEVEYCGGILTPLRTGEFTGMAIGLTKREHFAGLAMQGFCVSESTSTYETIAIWSVCQADALITALNETKI